MFENITEVSTTYAKYVQVMKSYDDACKCFTLTPDPGPFATKLPGTL